MTMVELGTPMVEPVGGYFPVPVSPERIDEIREWCAEHCLGDWINDLGQRALFERAEDATLAMLWWYRTSEP